MTYSNGTDVLQAFGSDSLRKRGWWVIPETIKFRWNRFKSVRVNWVTGVVGAAEVFGKRFGDLRLGNLELFAASLLFNTR